MRTIFPSALRLPNAWYRTAKRQPAMLESGAEVIVLDRFPRGEVHRVLDDGTKEWLKEAERSFLR